MKTQISYAVCCPSVMAGVRADFCLDIYIDIYIFRFTYCVYKNIYIFKIHQSRLVHVPSVSSLCWCQGILSGYNCLLIFPKIFCTFHLHFQHEYICVFTSVDFNLSVFPFFCVWFSHAHADRCKPLRLPELQFCQYSKTLLLLYHTRLSVSAKSSCKWLSYC